MGGVVSQLAQLFSSTLPTVIFVLLLFVILERLLFRPLTAVLKEREDETTGAMARAREQTASAEEKARQYESTFQAARQDVYRQRETARRATLEDRAATLNLARQQSEALLKAAQTSLAANVASSKDELQTACRSLGEAIAETILRGPRQGAGEGAKS